MLPKLWNVFPAVLTGVSAESSDILATTSEDRATLARTAVIIEENIEVFPSEWSTVDQILSVDGSKAGFGKDCFFLQNAIALSI